MRKSFRSEIQPTSSQLCALRQHAGNARWAYNWGLAKKMAAYSTWEAAGKPSHWNWPSAISLHKELNILKMQPVDHGGVPWMYMASKCAPQEALRDLDSAFKALSRRRKKGLPGGYPKFKSRSSGLGGFRLTGSILVEDGVVQLPRLGRLRIKPGDRGYIPSGRYGQVAVREDCGRWFVAVTGPEVQEPPQDQTRPQVGIDLGITQLATLSNGVVIENPKFLERAQKQLKKAQRTVSRRKKGSSNRRKAVARLKNKHRRVRDLRKDYIHKFTTMIAKSFGLVVLEKLGVQQMMQRVAGDSKAARRVLNRLLSCAAFYEIRRQLEYKGKLYGCKVITVNPAYTSQRCSKCGHTCRGNRLTRSRFQCVCCGHSENADVNAARNILVAGSSSETENACGGDVNLDMASCVELSSEKQELVSAIRGNG